MTIDTTVTDPQFIERCPSRLSNDYDVISQKNSMSTNSKRKKRIIVMKRRQSSFSLQANHFSGNLTNLASISTRANDLKDQTSRI